VPSNYTPPVTDSAAVDAALVARLLGDAGLMALMPDGVYFDVARPGARRFVIVSIPEHHDVDVFGGRAVEEITYLVKAVAINTSGGDTRAAALRIDALLADTTWPIEGYGLMSSARVQRVRYPEPDDEDPDIRWQHAGARYLISVAIDRHPKVTGIYTSPLQAGPATVGWAVWFDQPLTLAPGELPTLAVQTDQIGTLVLPLFPGGSDLDAGNTPFGWGQCLFYQEGFDFTGHEGMEMWVDEFSATTGWDRLRGPFKESIDGSLVGWSTRITVSAPGTALAQHPGAIVKK
jgi:hypothetical protein